MVGATSSEMANVGGEEDPCDVGAVSREFADGDERSDIAVLDHAPYKDTASVVAGAKHGTIRSYRDAGDGDIVFGDQLVTAFILAQIPDTYSTSTIAADEFSLVWVDDYIIDCVEMVVVALDAACSSVPYLDSAVFRGRNHPFSLAVKGHACNVVCVTFEGEDSAGVGGLDVVEFNGVVASGGKISLVGGDA